MMTFTPAEIAAEVTKSACQMLAQGGLRAPAGFGCTIDRLDEAYRLTLTGYGNGGHVLGSDVVRCVEDMSLLLAEMMGAAALSEDSSDDARMIARRIERQSVPGFCKFFLFREILPVTGDRA